MGFSRKQALSRIQALWPRVQQHYFKLVSHPEHQGAEHWRAELREWLQQMKERLPYVGKKTASQWQARLQPFSDAVQE